MEKAKEEDKQITRTVSTVQPKCMDYTSRAWKNPY